MIPSVSSPKARRAPAPHYTTAALYHVYSIANLSHSLRGNVSTRRSCRGLSEETSARRCSWRRCGAGASRISIFMSGILRKKKNTNTNLIIEVLDQGGLYCRCCIRDGCDVTINTLLRRKASASPTTINCNHASTYRQSDAQGARRPSYLSGSAADFDLSCGTRPPVPAASAAAATATADSRSVVFRAPQQHA